MYKPLQQISKTTYKINVENVAYIVTLSRLQNCSSGCPRYNALITPFDGLNQDNESICYSFNFRGSYRGEKQEAQEIAEHVHILRNKGR